MSPAPSPWQHAKHAPDSPESTAHPTPARPAATRLPARQPPMAGPRLPAPPPLTARRAARHSPTQESKPMCIRKRPDQGKTPSSSFLKNNHVTMSTFDGRAVGTLCDSKAASGGDPSLSHVHTQLRIALQLKPIPRLDTPLTFEMVSVGPNLGAKHAQGFRGLANSDRKCSPCFVPCTWSCFELVCLSFRQVYRYPWG